MFIDEEFLEPEDENEDDLNEDEDEVIPPEDHVAKLMKQLKSSGAAIIKRVNPGEITPTKPPLTIEPALIKQHSPVVKSLNLAAIIKPGSHLAALIKPVINSNLAAIIKPTPPPSLSCKTCNEDFQDSLELHDHLMIHVKMPNLVLDKLASDDEEDEENQEDWSDEEDDQETEIPVKKVVNSNILQSLGMGISIKKAVDSSSGLLPNPSPNVQIKTQQGEENVVKQAAPAPSTPALADSAGNASGSLKLTIKHSSGKYDFQVVNNDPTTEIKKEPTVPGSVPTLVPTALPRTAPAVLHADFIPAPTTINSRRNSTWDSVDIKDGILEECRIKTEPSVISSYPSTAPPFVNPLSSMASMESRIKNEVGSGPGSPASPSDSIKVKSFAFEQQEKEARQAMQQQLQQPTIPKPMVIPKKEPNMGVAIIEINGDDSDNDDIMFVDSTPATIVDKKPIILQKRAQITELPSSPLPNLIRPPPATLPQVSRPTTSTVNSSTTPHISTEKQHNFNWNAPSTKSSLESMLTDKSTDAIFESLMASHRKESNSDSEYISLDTLGPQHTCEVCNTRYSDLRLLESHQRATGHSSSIVLSSAGGNKSSSLVPASYGQGGRGDFLLNSLFPVKQLAETVGKLTTNHSSSSGFSHQQNIMVNIQSFPPQGQNFMPGQQPPGGYPGMHQQMPPGYPPGYGMPDPSQGQYSQYPPAPPYGAPGYGGYPPAQPPHGSSMYNHQPPNPPGYPQVPPYNSQMPYGQNQYNPNQGQLPPNSMSGQIPTSVMDQGGHQSPGKLGGIRIQNPQSPVPGQKLQQAMGARMANPMQGPRGLMKPRGGGVPRGRGGGPRMGIRPSIRPGVQVQGQAIRGGKPNLIRTPMKRPGPTNGAPHTPTKKRLDMLLPDRHDNEDCQVMSMQQQRDGFPMIDSIKGSKEPCPNVNIGSGLTVTKTRVRPPSPHLPANKDAGTVASLLAQRGIRITAKPKSPSPPPINIPNLGSGISITKKSVSSNFVIPEESYDYSCSVCSKTFTNTAALNVHMSQMHPSAKLAKCDSCPVSYPTYQQLHEHKKLFHNSVSEMGLPVIDFSQQANLKKLTSLGIFNFIPLANREQGNGCFGIPIVSVQNAMNGTLNSSLQALGAGGLLSLGPVKPLPKC